MVLSALIGAASVALSAVAAASPAAEVHPPAAAGVVLRPAPPQAAQTRARPDPSIRPCRKGPVANYLERVAQRCWYDARNGRWRTLRHELHYYSLVVEVEAESLADADEIASRFVKVHSEKFREIMLYVQAAPVGVDSLIRRIRWLPGSGYDTLEFTGTLRR
jgi:hypothetical protein